MEKHIVVELDEDGFIAGIHCPDDKYCVHVLYREDLKKDIDQSLYNYYKEVEKLIPNLKNCY